MSSEERENWKWVERKVERGEDKKKGREKLKKIGRASCRERV